MGYVAVMIVIQGLGCRAWEKIRGHEAFRLAHPHWQEIRSLNPKP